MTTRAVPTTSEVRPAPATNFITRGANTVAEWIGPGRNTRPYASTGGTHMKVHRAVAGAWILMACAELAGCSSADERLPPAVTTEVARDFNQGDALRTAANYTDDAQILAPQHPAVLGKAAIVAFFKANIDKYLGFGNDTTWSLVRGDVAIEQGVYSVRNVRVGENVEAGKYIRIWKRTNNGTWKLYRDMYSSDSETPAAVSVSPEQAPGQELMAK
jgi:ketosteroid isomerase-like protein